MQIWCMFAEDSFPFSFKQNFKQSLVEKPYYVHSSFKTVLPAQNMVTSKRFLVLTNLEAFLASFETGNT